ncbi:MAG: DUF4238 domain-containing protein [Cytophagales bacterium]|nr:DUF4238 domain-containing protein [Cytophagales bacterium]
MSLGKVNKRSKNAQTDASWRHHYIPKFLIEGFTNADNKVFVYDKLEDGGQGKIRNKPVPPKSIFFEKHRNTMVFDTGTSSVIEDYTYNKLDTYYSKFFRELKSYTEGNEEIPNGPLYGLHLFVMNLFWRIPAQDPAAKRLSDVINEGIEDSGLLKALGKHQKTAFSKLTLSQASKNLEKEPHYKVFTCDDPIFILTDNPTVYERRAEQFKELDELKYIFPVSSQMVFVYSGYNRSYLKLSPKIVRLYNALAIDQSVRYTVSFDRENLESNVKTWKDLKERNLLEKYKQTLFSI